MRILLEGSSVSEIDAAIRVLRSAGVHTDGGGTAVDRGEVRGVVIVRDEEAARALSVLASRGIRIAAQQD